VAQAVLGGENQECSCLMLQPNEQTGGRIQTGEKRGEQGEPPWCGYPSIVCDSRVYASGPAEEQLSAVGSQSHAGSHS
jgi:hypothetical protein